MVVRVIGVNGSPRKYGNTFQALRIALEAARAEGAEVELIHLYDFDIKPCMGCVSEDVRACRYPCPINDDMRKLYPKVIESDGMIIASPIYWFNVSGPLKNFIDRLTALENMIFIDGRSWLDGKVVGFIAVGNDEGAIAVISNLMVVTNSLGMVIPPWALAYYVDSGNAAEDSKLVMDSANVGRAVTVMCQVLKGERQPPKVWYRADDDYKLFVSKVSKQVLEEANQLVNNVE